MGLTSSRLAREIFLQSSLDTTKHGSSLNHLIHSNTLIDSEHLTTRTVQPITPVSSNNLDIRSGFLPKSSPLTRLPQPWSQWEEVLDQAQVNLQPGLGEQKCPKIARWRESIRSRLPIISVEDLENRVDHLRRAHLVLAFLMHFYVHSDQQQEEQAADHLRPQSSSDIPTVPSSIAVPLVRVSQMIDLPPVLTYADSVLYNWSLIDPASGFTAPNIKIETTFTGTESEAHFYKTSILVEALGPACLSLMRSSLDEAIIADNLSVSRISSNLLALSGMIDQIREVLEKVRDLCDPKIFYWVIRPWMNGGKRRMESVKDVNLKDSKEWLITCFGGPSAGQSTLIHSLDVFLGVDHSSPSQTHPPDTHRTNGFPQKKTLVTTPENPDHISPQVLTGEETFMERMSAYMPYHHRRFLSELSRSLAPSSQHVTFPSLGPIRSHSVRSLALASPPNSEIRISFNRAVHSLENLRTFHTKIAVLYIISQSHSAPPMGSPFEESWYRKQEVKRRQQEEEEGVENSELQKSKKEGGHIGTGGTDLSIFLKRCRERTHLALLPHTSPQT